MERYQVNALKVKNRETGKEHIVESQEHCDLLWSDDSSGALAGDYIFHKYPDNISEIEFTIWETKQKVYFTVLEYSFDYGKIWSKL